MVLWHINWGENATYDCAGHKVRSFFAFQVISPCDCNAPYRVVRIALYRLSISLGWCW